MFCWVRDSNSFRDFHIIFVSSDPYKYAVTTSIDFICKFILAAIDIKYRNVIPSITGE
jgi:hypothetical protein